MLEVIYQNLGKVQKMYESTFGINFPDIKELSTAVGVRHDLVHRNGKNKEGELTVISVETIETLLINIIDFVEQISIELDL